jgi:hypothetical protein
MLLCLSCRQTSRGLVILDIPGIEKSVGPGGLEKIPNELFKPEIKNAISVEASAGFLVLQKRRPVNMDIKMLFHFIMEILSNYPMMFLHRIL